MDNMKPFAPIQIPSSGPVSNEQTPIVAQPDSPTEIPLPAVLALNGNFEPSAAKEELVGQGIAKPMVPVVVDPLQVLSSISFILLTYYIIVVRSERNL